MGNYFGDDCMRMLHMLHVLEVIDSNQQVIARRRALYETDTLYKAWTT